MYYKRKRPSRGRLGPTGELPGLSLRTVLPTAKNARYIAVLVGYQGEGILPPVHLQCSTVDCIPCAPLFTL